MSRPKTAKKSARKAKGNAAPPASIRLSERLVKGDFEVDAEAGTLKGVSIITRGAAKGHGFDIDDVMVEQVADAINARSNGIRSHLGHSMFSPADGIEIRLGRFQNAVVDSEKSKVRADFTFGPYAQDVPGRGDVKTYLMHLVEEDPSEVALSIDFVPGEMEEREDEEGRSLPPAARLQELLAVDWVDDPAANPGGLLSGNRGPGDAVSPEKEDSLMNPKVREYLESLGLKKEASDEDALRFQEDLTDAQKAEVARLQEGEGDGAGDPPPPPVKKEGEEDEDDKKADEAVQQKADKAVQVSLARQQKRRDAVAKLAREYGMPVEDADKLAADPAVTVETAAQKVLEWLKTNQAPLRIHVGADLGRDSFGDAMVDAVCLRAGVRLYEDDEFTQRSMRSVRPSRADVLKDPGLAHGIAPARAMKTRKPHERARQMQGLSMTRLAAAYLRTVGVPGVDMIGETRIIDLAMSPRQLAGAFPAVNSRVGLAHSTSDFPLLLADVLNKSLRAAYVEYPKTWPIWVRPTTNADFKEMKRLALSGAQDLVVRPEGAEVKYGTMAETREQYALAEYVRGFRYTRRMAINDDLDAFDRLPRMHMVAAARLEEDLVYAVVTANAAMADGIALFAVAHANLINAPLTTAGLDWGRRSMRLQRGIPPAVGIQGPLLNLIPVYLLVPARLEGNALRLLQSEYVPEAQMGHTQNIWRGQLTPIVQPRLDADDPENWYLAADYNQIDVLEICFLEGEQVPILKAETDFDTDDLKLVVRHTLAVKAIDHRGVVKSEGGESGESGSAPTSLPAD